MAFNTALSIAYLAASVRRDSHNANSSNRLARTRTPGGVAGERLAIAAPYVDSSSFNTIL